MLLDDVNTRARGLGTHLLDRAALLRVLEAGTRVAAIRCLARLGFPLEPARALADFDRAIGQVVAARLGLLRRWLGPRSGALAAIFDDEDRRTLRILLRGAAQGAPPAARLAGVVPTPGLPDRLLDRLSRASSPAGLGTLLTRAGHPAGRAIAAALDGRGPGSAAGATPDLFLLELALARMFALRARTTAWRAGPAVRRYVGSLIDRENVWSLLAVEEWSADLAPEAAFLEGGAALTVENLTALARAGRERMRTELSRRLAKGPLGGVFDDGAGPPHPTGFEARALAASVTWYRQAARHDPLGPAVLFMVVERIRAEAHDLRLVLAALAVGAASTEVDALLATAP